MTTSLLTPKTADYWRRQRLLEEILETEEVLGDEALMESIRESEEDVKAGRVYSLDELKHDLRAKRKL